MKYLSSCVVLSHVLTTNNIVTFLLKLKWLKSFFQIDLCIFIIHCFLKFIYLNLSWSYANSLLNTLALCLGIMQNIPILKILPKHIKWTHEREVIRMFGKTIWKFLTQTDTQYNPVISRPWIYLKKTGVSLDHTFLSDGLRSLSHIMSSSEL